jgi:hypothetical protein
VAYRWTPELQEKVTQYVRAGGFVWVAAEAAGLPRGVLEQWMRRGAESARQPYRGFRDAILQARAQSRLKAEMETRSKAPRDWLRLGPGRERPGQPGWSNPPKAEGGAASGSNAFALRDVGRLAAHLWNQPDITPEVRIRLADALTDFPGSSRDVVDYL